MSLAGNRASISGASYVLTDRCGAIRQGTDLPCTGPRAAVRALEERGVLRTLPRNFGRFDETSLRTFAAVIWACLDAGLPLDGGKRRIGILGSSPEGALDPMRAFFEDYAGAGGRSSARSNLFVYTLPTTPLAEAALFCGFTGPLLYLYQSADPAGCLLEETTGMVAEARVEAMLAIHAQDREAVCWVVQEQAGDPLCPVSPTREQFKTATSVRDLVRVLDRAKNKK